MARLTKLRTVALLALLAALAASPAAAQTTSSSWTFETVDDVQVYTNTSYASPQVTVTVTGIVQGESAATTHSAMIVDEARATAEACERMALLALSKPGQYRFTLSGVSGCKLARVAP